MRAAGGDFLDARHRLERVYSEKSGDLAIAFKLALVLARTGAADRAIPLLNTVIQGDPDNVDALVDLAGALLQSGRAGDAIAYFQRATERDGQLLLAWNGLGIARLQSGDRTGAIEAFQRSLRLDPNQPAIADALRRATR